MSEKLTKEQENKLQEILKDRCKRCECATLSDEELDKVSGGKTNNCKKCIDESLEAENCSLRQKNYCLCSNRQQGKDCCKESDEPCTPMKTLGYCPAGKR